MVVTNIERQKRHAGRVNVYIDGRFAFGLNEEILLKSGLRKGDTLDRATYDALAAAEELSRAKQSGLRLLSYRMRTEKEMRGRLYEKEFPPDVIDKVVGQFLQLGLIDDREFARAFVRDARLRKPSGRRLLMQQMRLRGVPPAIIQETLAEAVSAEDEQEAALSAARKVARRYRPAGHSPLDRKKQQQRMAQFLARRGFSWSAIAPVLKTIYHSDLPTQET